MSDVKTVKVDNWGSFFLQKLQNFFNKTDYCDLTLQFRDNSQLKVHRLVLSACTDYFNILETSTECQDDILMMPRDLQADVVVPIVNFMYTGTLEFEVRMYERLLKTARDMKMSVLLKLLEAHRRAMPIKPEPIILNRSVQSRPAMRGGGFVSTRGRAPARTYSSRYMANNSEEQQEGSGSDFERLRRTGVENPTGKRPMAAAIRSASPPQKKPNLQDVKEYTEAARLRKQLNEGDDDVAVGDYDMDDNYSQSSGDEATPRQSMSLLQSNHKKTPDTTPAGKNELTTATVTLQELPGQKMDHAKIISEVMKKYPHLLKNNKNIKLKITQKTPGVQGTSFTVHAEAASPTTPAAKPAAASTTPLARALLASKQQQAINPVKRVGRPPGSTNQRSLVVSKAPVPVKATPPPPPPVKGNRIDSRTMHKLIAMGAENMEGPWLCLKCGVDGKPIGIPSYRAFRKHLINTHYEKIDARLCEHCGHRSQNRQELYHHIQVQHQIMPPQGVVFPVCKVCKFVAVDQPALEQHETEKGHGRSPVSIAVTRTRAAAAATAVKKSEAAVDKSTDEYQCEACDKSFTTKKALSMHRVSKHRRPQRTKVTAGWSEDEAETEESADEQDVDFDSALHEDVDYVPQGKAVTPETSARKVKVLSNVVTMKGKTRSSEAESLTTVATGIATSLRLGEDGSADHSAELEYQEEIVDDAQYIEEALANVHGESKAVREEETKFIAEDGSEIQLTAAEKAELMSQLDTSSQDKSTDEVVMMYEHEDEVDEAIDTAAEQEEVVVGNESAAAEVLKDGDEVLMVYGGPRSAAKVTKADKEDVDADEEEEEVMVDDELEAGRVKEEQPSMEVEDVDADEEKVENEKNKLIQELEGDWDDDADEKPEEEATSKSKSSVVTKESAPNKPDDDEKEPKKEVKEEEVTPNVSMTEEALKVEVESPVKDAVAVKPAEVASEKKATDATLAEFMNDWDE